MKINLNIKEIKELNLKAFIFDIDGTLTDTLPLCYDTLRETLFYASGERYTDEEVRKFFGPSEEGIFRRHFPERWEEILDFYLNYYETYHDVRPWQLPEIPPLLSRLKAQGHKLAIVSGKGNQSTKITLDKAELNSYFEIIRTGRIDGPWKAEAIAEVVKQWDLKPEEVGYIGDIVYDMKASLQAATIPIGAAWSSTARYHHLVAAGAYITFTVISDFEKWIFNPTT